MNLYTKSEKSSGKLGVHTKWLVFNLLQEHSNFTLMPYILNHLICRFMKMYIKKISKLRIIWPKIGVLLTQTLVPVLCIDPGWWKWH